MANSKKTSRGKIILPLIVCFFAAVIVWLTVMYGASPTVTRTVSDIPVEGEKAPFLTDNYECHFVDTLAEVSFEGTRKDFVLCGEDVKAVVDLSNIGRTSGAYTCPVRFEFPEHVTLTETKPVTVSVTVAVKE